MPWLCRRTFARRGRSSSSGVFCQKKPWRKEEKKGLEHGFRMVGFYYKLLQLGNYNLFHCHLELETDWNFDIRMTTIVMIMKIVLEKMYMDPCWWVVPRQMTNIIVKRVASDRHFDFEKNADSTQTTRWRFWCWPSLTPPASIKNLHINILHKHLPSSSMLGWYAST